MALATRFEDLRVWQSARELTKRVYNEAGKGKLSRDVGLRDQLRRASVSVMSNIAEGFDRRTKRDFANFLGISRASLAETKSLIYISTDLEYIRADVSEDLLRQCESLRNSLGALLKSLRASE